MTKGGLDKMNRVEDNDTFVRLIQAQLQNAGCYTGNVDGWAGALTRKAYASHVQILPHHDSMRAVPVTIDLETDNTSARLNLPPHTGQKLYAHAWKDNGLRELPGRLSAERIQYAIKTAAAWLDDDDSKTAWCGCILGLWCTELQLPVPKDYYRAANWLQTGQLVMISDARKGDVVVLTRQGGNHVGLYHSHDHTHVTLLGGNQSNMVNLTRYSLGTLRGVRRL